MPYLTSKYKFITGSSGDYQPARRGKGDPRGEVEAINAFLRAQLPLDHFEVCYHDEADLCNCRKPKPGLIYRSASALDVDVTTGFVVGDRWRDIEAGRAAGCRTVWIDRGYDERSPVDYDHRTNSLLAAVKWIIQQ